MWARSFVGGPVAGNPTYTYWARVQRVIDGDTLVCLVDLGFHIHTMVHIRLLGVSCPELREPGGIKARDFTVAQIAAANGEIVLTTTRDPARTFARYLGTVSFADGTDLGRLLVEHGHGIEAGA